MIGIYQLDPSTGDFRSISDGNFSSPISAQISPSGRASVQKLWARNGDALKYYKDISIEGLGVAGIGLPSGVGIKMKIGKRKPLLSEWEVASASLGVGDFTDLGSAEASDLQYYPFWVELKADGGLPIGETRIQLAIGYTEGLVA